MKGGAMDVLQAIKERRSVRTYKTDAVSSELLDAVLDAARWAPSWGNFQVWKFVVVRDPEIKAKLAEILYGGMPGRQNRSAVAIQTAPITIVACAETGLSGFGRGGEALTDKGDWYMFDVALAMQNIALAAHAMGLGTVHVGLFDAAAAARILGVPQNVRVVEMTPLGYPDEQPMAPRRKELSEFVFQDKYAQVEDL
jgi:nitroreductase